MSAICLIGAMLYTDGVSTDERYALNAYGISMLTKLGLAELGITEQLDVDPSSHVNRRAPLTGTMGESGRN